METVHRLKRHAAIILIICGVLSVILWLPALMFGSLADRILPSWFYTPLGLFYLIFSLITIFIGIPLMLISGINIYLAR